MSLSPYTYGVSDKRSQLFTDLVDFFCKKIVSLYSAWWDASEDARDARNLSLSPYTYGVSDRMAAIDCHPGVKSVNDLCSSDSSRRR